MVYIQALFALEDIIGGHSAVANFVVKVLAFVAKHQEVQKKVQGEVDSLLNGRSEKRVMIADRNKLIYTEAVIMESLRIIASPIVPHVANQDSSIDGNMTETEHSETCTKINFLSFLLPSRLFCESGHFDLSQ